MRYRARDAGAKRFVVRAVGVLLLGALVSLPGRVSASCCVCRTCAGADFCVDAIQSLPSCAEFCTAAGCPSGVYDSGGDCAGGCDGAPEVATATPTGTPSGSPTLTPTQAPTDTPTVAPSATPSETPTAGPTGTPTGTPALGGNIRYYFDDRPVPNVSVAVIGDQPQADMTDVNGDFGFHTITGGNESLRPSKQGDTDNGITGLDASYVLQLVAGLRTFSSDQRLACDVTGNGAVTALDATRILQFQADLLQRFAVADLCSSDWLFRPEPSPAQNQTVVMPMIASGICQQGRINYSPLVPPANGQAFVAILFGDCTGNWNEQQPGTQEQ